MIASNAKADLTIKDINSNILSKVDKLSCEDIQNAQDVLVRTLYRLNCVAEWQKEIAKLAKQFSNKSTQTQSEQLIIGLNKILSDSGHENLLFKEGIMSRYKPIVVAITSGSSESIDVDITSGSSESIDVNIRNSWNEIGLLFKVEPPEPSAWQMTKTWFSKLWSSTKTTGGADGLTSK